MNSQNYIIKVECVGFYYIIRVADAGGKEMCWGFKNDKNINEIIGSFSNKEFSSVEWFINKANECYVYDINKRNLELGDWCCEFVVKNGTNVTFEKCFNI